MTTELPSYLPLYVQIKALITQRLRAGEWQPGEAIPSEMELASRFGVSQGTIRKAIDVLTAENVFIRRQGKGTFVATHTDEGEKYRFFRIKNRNGEKAYPASELLEFTEGVADEWVAEQLAIAEGAPLYILKRRLSLAGKPAVLDRISLPAARFTGLTAGRVEEHVNQHRGTLYGLYEAFFAQRIIRGEERITAESLKAEDAPLLGQAAGIPVLEVERIAYTYDHQPVEFRRSVWVTREHYYFSELS
jgi:GntR family transcriptional regulator